MANCVNYNCSELPDWTANDCNSILLGGISSFIILECDNQLTDPSSASDINTEIAAGRATLIEDVKVSIEAASPIEIESDVSCQPPRTVNYDRSGSLIDANVSDDNVNFYNNLFDGRAFGGIIIYECDSDQVTWIDAAVRFSGSRLIPNDSNDRQRFEGTFKWKALNNGRIYSAPTGIFT